MGHQLKIGILGVGKMGALHLEKFAEVENVAVVGFYDINPIRAEKMAQTHQVPRFDDLGELFFQIDAAVIATPTSTHFRLAKRALESGLHVLVEKPITEAVEDAEELIQIAERNNLVLQVGFLERFRYQELLRRLPSFLPRLIEAHRLSPVLGREESVDVIADLMIHDLDIVLSLVNEEPHHISAQGSVVVTERIDTAEARLEFPSGMIANLRASRVADKRLRTFQLVAPEAQALLDFIDNTATFRRAGDDGSSIDEVFSTPAFDALLHQARHFGECITKSCRPLVCGRSGLLSLKLAESIRQRIEAQGRTVLDDEIKHISTVESSGNEI